MIGTCVNTAVSFLRQGKIVAFPTETYYGLAVDPANKYAVRRLYELKKREAEKPLLLLIHNRGQLDLLVESIPPGFSALMDKYWPGALTLVFPAKKSVSQFIKGGTNSVGVRVSPHPVAAQLVSVFGNPITATSANLSGKLPAVIPTDITQMFGDTIDYILDGGVASAGLCSTILAYKKGKPVLLRQGQVQLDEEDLTTF